MNKRILKTGALAVAATVAFAIFAFRAAEWTKGLNSGFIAFGQTGGTGGGGGGGGGATTCTPSSGGGSTSGTGSVGSTTCTVKVIPQIAVGSFDQSATYSTIIEIVNTNANAVTVTGNFYKTDGTPSALVLATNLSSTPTFTGTLNAVTLGPSQVLVISGGTKTETTPANGSVAWGKLTTSGTVSIATFFELRSIPSSTVPDVLYGRVGVSASRADLQSFVIPRVRDVGAGLDVAFALVNTSTTSPATVTATLKDASGATLGTPTALTLAAGSQVAKFTKEFFFQTGNEPSLAAGKNYHYITFSSNSPSVAAIALAFEGGVQASFPVDVLQ